MTALTKDRQTAQHQVSTGQTYPVAASTKIYKGGMVCLNTSGYAVPAADTAGYSNVVGIADEQVDNSSGSNGDLNIRVVSGASFLLVGYGTLTQAMVGLPLYAKDDQTVEPAASSTHKIVAGVLVQYVSATSGYVFVPQGGQAGLSAGSNLRVVVAQATTVAASDTIVTGLNSLVAVVAQFDSDPSDDPTYVSASIGDQAGSPAAGSFYLKTWKNTGGTDPTPLAATTFSKKVNYIAIGT